MRVAEWYMVALVATPLLGALVAGLCPKRRIKLVRGVGFGFSLLALAEWISLWWMLSGSGADGLLVSVFFPWIPKLGVGFHLGLDHAGVMMTGMISLIAVAAVVGTLPTVPELNRSQIVFLLMAEAGMLGSVASWDLILFIAFWEMTLVPFFFLMGRGPIRGGVSAASRFVITSVVSSVLMWVGVLGVVNLAGSPRTFDLVELTQRLSRGSYQLDTRIWLFAPAFLVRMAAVPLHTWYPTAAANVPTAASIMLAGGVLPLGGYGIFHVLCRLFGSQLCGTGSWLMWLGLITCLVGALASMVQRDLKRLLAHICLAQVGLALVGIVLPNSNGSNPGLTMLMAVGLEGCALFLFAGVICQARGSQRIMELSGLWRSHPFFAGLAFAGVASASAIPGTIGFVGAMQTFRGVSGDWVLTTLTALGVLLTGMSMLWVFRRVLGGSFQSEIWTSVRWPRKRQIMVQLLIAMVVIAVGIFPGLLVLGSSPASHYHCQNSANPVDQTSLSEVEP